MKYEFSIVYKYENLYFGRFDMTDEEKREEAYFIIKKALEELFDDPLSKVTEINDTFLITSGESIFDYVGRAKLVLLRRDLEREFCLTFSLQDDEPPVRSDVFGKMCDYVGKNYLYADFSAKSIADYMEMDKTTVDIAFKTNCGMPAKDYIMKKRIDMAKELLLLRTNMDDCAERCGFGSEKTMRRAFKEKLNMTPAQFKKIGLNVYSDRAVDDEF